MTGTLKQFDILCRNLRVAADMLGEGDVIAGQRRGQYVFNQMAAAFPEIANALAGTAVDPFYLNENIPTFLDACENRALEILS